MEVSESAPPSDASLTPAIVADISESAHRETPNTLVDTNVDVDEPLNEEGSPARSSSVPSPTNVLPCEMCHNYEANLTKLQARSFFYN
ncbi:unnamed protein product [Toxocara canis]|uniref:LITAF domain-containing protein n=1 Tax=Toxocara canis TaxID=6265 RepID=A0A183UVP5_TOXCA|nr:unnamed protein product [Toxocara canis]